MKQENYNTKIQKEWFICRQCLCSACTRFQCPRSSRWSISSCKCACDGVITSCDFYKNKFRNIRFHYKRKKVKLLSFEDLRKLSTVINEILGEASVQAEPELKPNELFVQEVQKEREKRKKVSQDGASDVSDQHPELDK